MAAKGTGWFRKQRAAPPSASNPKKGHPGVDARTERALHVETRAPVIHLSQSRAEVLAAAVAQSYQFVMVSKCSSAMTYPLRERLLAGEGAWMVRSPDGERYCGMTGRTPLSTIDDAISPPPPGSDTALSPYFLRHEPGSTSAGAEPAPVQQVLVSLSVQHPMSATTSLGHAIESLAVALTGAPPTGWGTQEPVQEHWDRGTLTTWARNGIGREPLAVVVGDELVGTVQVRRTPDGIEEVTQLLAATGPPGTGAGRAALERVTEAIALVGTTQSVALGFVSTRAGRADLLFPPFVEAPFAPLAVVLGSAALVDLDNDDALPRALAATFVGTAGAMAAVLPLWPPEQADTLIRTVGADRLRASVIDPATRAGHGSSIPEVLRAL